MKSKAKFWPAAVLAAVFIVYVVLVRSVDAEPIGPGGTTVGFSHLNQAVANFTGVNMGWYDITGVLGIAAIAVGLCFAVLGLWQLLKRKSLLGVDRNIIALGGLYVVLAVLYVFFEKVIVNYRPIIMPGEEFPEASFPSSHTMLVCVVMGSAMLVLKDYVKNASLRLLLQVVFVLIIVATVCGRLFSGVHWFTDIIGGVLISAVLLSFFDAVLGDPDKPHAAG